MKLAEALQIRADLQRRLAQMLQRLENNATVQEGTEPAENPESLLRELDTLTGELERLMTRINLTNARAAGEDGVTITALMARRDILRSKADTLRRFLNAASSIAQRRQSTDIRILPTVDVSRLRKRCDGLSKELRETDLAIQKLNWTTDLID